VAVQQLDRLDKDPFSNEDREQAAKIREERREEELLLVSTQLYEPLTKVAWLGGVMVRMFDSHLRGEFQLPAG